VYLNHILEVSELDKDEMMLFLASGVTIMMIPNMVKNHLLKMHLSSNSIPIYGLPSKTIWFKEYGTLNSTC